ncbi:MAG TPA: indole-3-glycerol phosphate synthase TrpC [Abditibacteriaceae bacterium]|jgi:indole-3-glycerol phosphate synthase
MILDDIVAATKERVKRDLENDTLLKLEARLPDDQTRPFAAALKHPNRLGLIAEIKKASPSKGVLAPDFDPQRQAELYRDGGADCLSVLTEPQFFQGDLEHLRTAREISGKPCLRKDFIIDQYQIAQARLYGADCILMIAAILTDWQIRNFKHTAREYGMDALLEIHNEEEARRAVSNGCNFIGINNRDLKTFNVDLATTERLRPLLPENVTVVAESGVSTREDAQRLRAAGADALLVGETLMKADDVGAAIRALLGGDS